ncbi:MAG: Lar family restriction alleviation protein [Bacteroidota bacterium]|nr:Lar family restriction alleviation protein [Bacteroidota bacterium]
MSENKLIELKPCPFCGKTESVRIKIYPNINTFEIEQYAIVCDHIRGGCGSESGHYNDVDDAIKYWNQRM